MNIFNKRPLFLVLCIGLCGFFLFSLCISEIRVALVVISILLAIIALFVRKIADRRILLLSIAITLLVSCFFSHIYYDRFFYAYDLYDERVEIEGVVEGISETSSYTTRLHVKANKVNGKNKSRYSFYAYVKKADAKGIIEGTKISFTASLEGFSDESRSFNIAKGINAYASDVEDVRIIEYTNGGIRGFFSKMREISTRYIILKSDKNTGAIISALLLGEREYLPDQLRLDFRRIGISHILALSGMHLAFLSLGIERILLLLRIKKKTRVITTVVFVILYMALTGFSVSVVRSGLMLLIGYTLYLLSRSKDSLTSLAVAVTIICLISPNAVYDISLQLSALATFGIILLGEISITRKSNDDIKGKLINYFSMGILASIFAISATFAISTLNFGGFSIIAPITTIIFSLFAEAIMYLGCLLLLIGWLLPIGWVISPVCFAMSKLAGAFSSFKIAYVSSNFDIAVVLILIYTVLFYLFAILRFKQPIKWVNALVVLFFIVTTVPTVSTVVESNKETVAYYSDVKCDEMLVRSKNQVCLINSAQYAKNLAYTTIEFLEDAKVTFIDKYYLTHYSWSIDDEIEILLSNVLIDEIYLPEPRNKDENTILKVLYKAVEDYRVKIVLFKEYETVTVGDYNINLLYSVPYGSTSMNSFVVAKGDMIYTYISSGVLASEKSDYINRCISLSDYVIFGEHGKKYGSKMYIDKCFEDIDGIIINGENVFLTQESMKYYSDKECVILSHPKDVVYFK